LQQAMAAEPTTRFSHLLQPIRDLSKVWKIEIAEELERYIEEVGQLLVLDPVDGIINLNFAEAALLIQGSTAIYSRKVELLYTLVYQALDLLALDKKDGKKGGKVVQSGLWAPIPETDELLTIDHLIKEGRNIMLDHSAPESRQATQRRVPLFLMPRDQEDRNKNEFRISSCTVHHTGVYLLQESDAKLLDDIMDTEEHTRGGMDGPMVPAPPREVQDLDDRLQELLREIPQDDALDLPGDALAPASPEPKGGDDAMGKATPNKLKTPLASKGLALAGLDASRKGMLAAHDPWALMDEHESVGHDLPLEVGKTSKRVNAKKLLTTAEGLPDPSDCRGLTDAELWDAASGDKGIAQMLAAGHPVESLFLAVAGHLKSGGRYEVQRAGFSAAWLEFEDLFAQAAVRRRALKASLRRPGAPGTPHASDDEGSDVEAAVAPDLSSTAIAMTPKKGGMATELGLTPLPDCSAEQLRQDERREEVARLETMIQDAQSKYETTIRQHLQTMSKDAADGDARFPELYANVRKWQDQLEPVLKEFESRPEFDIHEYSNKFLDKIKNIPKSAGDPEGEHRTIKFSRLVHGQPRWEVCRRFLTCLILTNTGNTDIVYDSEEQRLNDFSMKLIKGEKKWISLGEGEEAAAVAPGKGRKSKAFPAAQEDTAPVTAPAKKKAKNA